MLGMFFCWDTVLLFIAACHFYQHYKLGPVTMLWARQTVFVVYVSLCRDQQENSSREQQNENTPDNTKDIKNEEK